MQTNFVKQSAKPTIYFSKPHSEQGEQLSPDVMFVPTVLVHASFMSFLPPSFVIKELDSKTHTCNAKLNSIQAYISGLILVNYTKCKQSMETMMKEIVLLSGLSLFAYQNAHAMPEDDAARRAHNKTHSAIIANANMSTSLKRQCFYTNPP